MILNGHADEWDGSDNADAFRRSTKAENRQDNIQAMNDAYDSPQRQRERKRQDRLDQESVNVRRDEMTMANNRFATTLKSQQNLHAHTASESAKDRALSRDLDLSSNNMNMQMKFMDMDLADKRMDYDRETRSMDKRDRMIAQLMSGLGQLGGAFAL